MTLQECNVSNRTQDALFAKMTPVTEFDGVRRSAYARLFYLVEPNVPHMLIEDAIAELFGL